MDKKKKRRENIIKMIIAMLIGCIVIVGASLVLLLRFGPLIGFYLVPQSPEDHMTSTISLMDYGIYSDSDEWAGLKEELLLKAKDVTDYNEANSLLDEAAKVSGGKHSKIISGTEEDAFEYIKPEVTMLSDGILKIWLPEFSGDSDEASDYVETVYNAVKQYQPEVKGLVLDLRDNAGGDMGPMLACVAAFLPDGEVLKYEIAGNDYPVTIKEGTCSGAGSTVTIEDFKFVDCPVAILQNEKTSGAGEGMLLCFRGLDHTRTFGSDSAGYCCSYNEYTLSEGSSLVLTTGKDVARTGEVFEENPVAPDQATDHAQEDAIQWLSEEIDLIWGLSE